MNELLTFCSKLEQTNHGSGECITLPWGALPQDNALCFHSLSPVAQCVAWRAMHMVAGSHPVLVIA